MLPDRVSNPGPLTYKSGALPIALRGPSHDPAVFCTQSIICELSVFEIIHMNEMYAMVSVKPPGNYFFIKCFPF